MALAGMRFVRESPAIFRGAAVAHLVQRDDPAMTSNPKTVTLAVIVAGLAHQPRSDRGEGARVEEWLRFVRCNRRIIAQLSV